MPRRSTPDRPTFTAIAASLGLSVSAVSLVMKDPQTSRVSQENRRRILAFVESGAVRPQRAALGTIGFVIEGPQSLSYSFVGDLLMGAQGEARRLGRAVVIESWRPDIGLLPQQAALDGLILAMPMTEDELAPLAARLPCLLLNQSLDQAPCDVAICDERLGIRLAIGHLSALGHRRIAYLGYESPGVPMAEWRWGFEHAERQRSFREAAAEAGMESADVRLLTVHPHSGREVLSIDAVIAAWRSATERPSAVVAFDDHVALMLIKAARAQGWRIPEDLAVVGRNDQPIAAHADPPLTTVAVDFHALGAQGMGLLRDRLDGQIGPPRRLLTPCRLVVRASTMKQ